MATIKPDPSFYPSPESAIAGPPEDLAYVVTLDTGGQQARRAERHRRRLRASVLGGSTCPTSATSCTTSAGTRARPPCAPGPPTRTSSAATSSCPDCARRASTSSTSRTTRASPKLTKVIEPDELEGKTGYSRPHTIHCGPDGLYVSALGAPDGDGPGGVFLLDHDDFSIKGQWEVDRGPQELAYDFWWNIGYDRIVTSEWGTPNMVEAGVNPELLLGGKYGHHLHVWDMRKRTHQQAIDLGPEQQMVLELRPAHDPQQAVGLRRRGRLDRRPQRQRLALAPRGRQRQDHRDQGDRDPGRAGRDRAAAAGAPALRRRAAAGHRHLAHVDDKTLLVSCWGTGELKRYDVTDPFHPRETGSVRLGGIVERAPHPSAGKLNGGPQMVEVSRDGKRVYLTNSLYASWDAQFYPEGIDGWMVKLDAEGDFKLDPDFFVPFEGERPHQVRLAGGDASSDSYCFPNSG